MDSQKGRNSTGALVQSVPPVDWTSLPRNAARGNIPRWPFQLKRIQQGNIWIYMQSNYKAEKLLSDVKRKVDFRSSQVEEFIDRKVSNQFLAIFECEHFILDRKKWPTVHFIPSTVARLNFVKKPHALSTAWK